MIDSVAPAAGRAGSKLPLQFIDTPYCGAITWHVEKTVWIEKVLQTLPEHGLAG